MPAAGPSSSHRPDAPAREPAGPSTRAGHRWGQAAGRAALVLVLGLGLLLGAAVAGPRASLGAPCADAAAVVRVGLVIDFGLLAAEQGAPAAVGATCVGLDGPGNGFTALQAAGHQLRVNSAGLLCAIDGYPQGSECGDRRAGAYRYWAYFHGSDTGWSYSGIGPGGVTLANGSVEGWHFVDGAGNPSDPPPAGPWSAASICPPAPTVPPPPPPTAAPVPTTAPPAAPAPGPDGAGPSGSAATPGTPGGPSSSVPTGPVDPTATVGAEGAPSAPDGTVAPAADAPPAGRGPVSDAAGGSGAAAAGTDPGSTVELASRPAAAPVSAGPPVAAIVALLAVAGLGLAAARRFRAGGDDL